jgi:hypothetical protein
VKVKIELSGGFSGITRSYQAHSDDLPSSLVANVRKNLKNYELSSPVLRLAPKSAADYQTYKITIEDGSKSRVIECNECNIQDDLKILVKYLEKHSR